MLRGIRYEDVWRNSRLEGLWGEDHAWLRLQLRQNYCLWAMVGAKYAGGWGFSKLLVSVLTSGLRYFATTNKTVGLLIKVDPELKTTACYAKKYIKVATSEIRRDKKAFGLTRVGINLSTNSQLWNRGRLMNDQSDIKIRKGISRRRNGQKRNTATNYDNCYQRSITNPCDYISGSARSFWQHWSGPGKSHYGNNWAKSKRRIRTNAPVAWGQKQSLTY